MKRLLRDWVIVLLLGVAGCDAAGPDAQAPAGRGVDTTDDAVAEVSEPSEHGGGKATADPTDTPAAAPTGNPIPTRTSTDAAFFAMTAGYLRGDAERGGGCLWLEEFPSGGIIAVVWPPGYSARFDPVELVGPDGDVMAREGDLIGLAGGSLSHGNAQSCDMGLDERWFAHEVLTDPELPGESPPPPRP